MSKSPGDAAAPAARSENLPRERAIAAARGLERLQLDFLAYQPSNIIAPSIEYFVSGPGAVSAPKMLLASREEEAVGIIGGALLAGRSGAILMQDNGFGNALTALTTFGVAYHIPLLIAANTRGGLGEYNSMIHTISEHAPTILRDIGVPVFRLDRTHSLPDWEITVEEAGRHALGTYRPVVVLMDVWGPGQ